MHTLTELQTMVKRRLRLLRATTGSGTEVEAGNAYSDNAITDALNSGRSQIAMDVKGSELWTMRVGVIPGTTVNVMDYSLDHAIIDVLHAYWDTDSDGERNANTFEMKRVEDAAAEEAAIRDPMNQPTVTNPMYRLCNQGIRLIVSTDGTLTASKYVRVEYISDLTELSGGSDNSNISHALDELCIDWAIHMLTETYEKSVSQVAIQRYSERVNRMNERFRRNQRNA